METAETLYQNIVGGLLRIVDITKGGGATSDSLAEAGKLLPKQGMGASGVNPPTKKCDCAKSDAGTCKCDEPWGEPADDGADAVTKHIKHEGDKWVLYTQDGSRVLGKHDSKQGAIDQENAIRESEAATTKSVDVVLDVSIIKSNDEKQLVTGLVLAPEKTDAQADIYDADVIQEAAHAFVAGYNVVTKLGFQHKDFKNWQGRFALVESWIAPLDLTIGTTQIKAGSWIMTVKVLDAAVWKLVKAGKIKGFSIGGKATVKKLPADASNAGTNGTQLL